MTPARVSVVIPCYNAGPYIEEAVRSALEQTVAPVEILVVDDGSTDDSAGRAASFGAPVRVVRQANQGESVARNRGILEARGDWIAFLDADDVWRPVKLERQLHAIGGRADVVCVHTDYFNFGDFSTPPQRTGIGDNGPADLVEQICAFHVMASSAIVRAGLRARFPEWTRFGEDTMYFADVALEGRLCYVREPLAGYRRTAQQQTRNPTSLISGHASWLRWIELHRATVDASVLSHIRERLTATLFEQLQMSKWKRDWSRYWTLRRYLRGLPDVANDPRLSETVYPRVVYRLKDYVDRARRHHG